MVGEKRQYAWRERGRDGAALMLPFLTLAEEKPAADQGAENSHGGRRAAVVGRVLHQHMMDRVGRIQQHALAAEELVDQDVLLIGLCRPHLERVAAQGP